MERKTQFKENNLEIEQTRVNRKHLDLVKYTNLNTKKSREIKKGWLWRKKSINVKIVYVRLEREGSKL